MREYKKIFEICEDENMLYLTDLEKADKDQTKVS